VSRGGAVQVNVANLFVHGLQHFPPQEERRTC
jgi:hypothetical protein